MKKLNITITFENDRTLNKVYKISEELFFYLGLRHMYGPPPETNFTDSDMDKIATYTDEIFYLTLNSFLKNKMGIEDHFFIEDEYLDGETITLHLVLE